MSETSAQQPVTTIRLIRSLGSELCPACGGHKTRNYPLCRGCYEALPADVRRALHASRHRGYQQAMRDALTALGTIEPHWPARASQSNTQSETRTNEQ
jgi:predicted amidophosphoribosyltransferase